MPDRPAAPDETAALRPPGRLRIAARILGVLALIPLVPTLVLYTVANGVTASGLALFALALAIGLLTVAPLPAGRRRVMSLGVAGACVAGILVFIAVRLLTPPPPQPFRFVESGRRDIAPPPLSRLADERETVLAGLALSSALGLIEGDEMRHLDRLLHSSYSEPWRPWPNAALVDASPDTPRHLEHVPRSVTPGARLPCLVFLHGFGGQLTAYLRVLDEAFGDRYVIVAPFLDHTGAFWRPHGRAAVNALVTRHLPPEADPARLFLIGLSNGAAGAAALLQDPALSRRFRGHVLVSGTGEAVEPVIDADVLVITGAGDPRFPLSAVQTRSEELRNRGAKLEIVTLPADHFLWLSHPREMTAAMDRWLSARL